MSKAAVKTDDSNVTAIKKTRTKSKETILKADMKAIRKELGTLDTKVAEFEAMKAEIEVIEETRANLQAELETVKHDLMVELGLADPATDAADPAN